MIYVVGGSGGIGYEICKKLKEKYSVSNLSRRKTDIGSFYYTDVTSYTSVQDTFNRIDIDNKLIYNTILNQGNKLKNVLIYCSGFVEPQTLEDMDIDIWDKTLKVNLTGAMYCTKEFLKYNKNQDSKIIYISSTAGTRPQPNWSAYASSKAGLINFALSMNEELKSYGISTYCISPGRCNTALRKKLAPDEDFNSIMQPNEVANIVNMLIEDENNLLAGQNILVRR